VAAATNPFGSFFPFLSPWPSEPPSLNQPILPGWNFGSIIVNGNNSSAPAAELAIVAKESCGHTYMLGPNGQSNGCVSFSDYPAFLNAFLSGEVNRLVVVEYLANSPDPETAWDGFQRASKTFSRGPEQ
jgi:hypothetical protein